MPKKKSPKSSRAPRGGGSVFPDNRRGGWVAKVPIGRKPNGRLKYKEVRGNTLAEVQEKKKRVAPPGPSTTLSAWCERWLASLDKKGPTLDSYRESVRTRIVPALGAKTVAAITTFDIEEAANGWGQFVAAGTVRKVLATLSTCLQAACRASLIERNPARKVPRPKVTPKELDLFTPAELDIIIERALTRPNWRPFAVCAATGCRIGEAIALDPSDYDHTTGRLSIKRTATRKHGKGEPKSKASKRTITVPPEARPALEAGVPNGHYANVYVRWKRLLALLGMRYRNIHSLKHSVASILVARGTDLADAAAYCGDTFEVFVRTYVHPTGSDPGAVLASALGGARAARLAAEAEKVPENPAKRAKES